MNSDIYNREFLRGITQTLDDVTDAVLYSLGMEGKMTVLHVLVPFGVEGVLSSMREELLELSYHHSNGRSPRIIVTDENLTTIPDVIDRLISTLEEEEKYEVLQQLKERFTANGKN